MKRLQHYKFISSIRSRAAPARCSCARRRSPQATGWAWSRQPLLSLAWGVQSHTLSKNDVLNGARQQGESVRSSRVVSMWWGNASSGIPGQLAKVYFHLWPQAMPCTRLPPIWEAPVALAQFTDLWNKPPDPFSKAESDSEDRCYMAGTSHHHHPPPRTDYSC